MPLVTFKGPKVRLTLVQVHCFNPGLSLSFSSLGPWSSSCSSNESQWLKTACTFSQQRTGRPSSLHSNNLHLSPFPLATLPLPLATFPLSLPLSPLSLSLVIRSHHSHIQAHVCWSNCSLSTVTTTNQTTSWYDLEYTRVLPTYCKTQIYYVTTKNNPFFMFTGFNHCTISNVHASLLSYCVRISLCMKYFCLYVYEIT